MATKWRSNEQIEQWFTFHVPFDQARVTEHSMVRAHCAALALWLNDNVPEGPEKTTAVNKVREAMFWANSALANAAHD